MNENKDSKCDLLKMDCEGAEFEIMQSLSDKELSQYFLTDALPIIDFLNNSNVFS